MRPKADPMPAAKSRALVIGASAAGLSAVIAAVGLSWAYTLTSSLERQAQIESQDKAQEASLAAQQKKADTEARVKLIKAEAEADVMRAKATKVNDQSESVDRFLHLTKTDPNQTDQGPNDTIDGVDKTDILTTLIIFKERVFAGGLVVTGWDFPNSSAEQPVNQYCYFSRSLDGKITSRLDIAKNGRSLRQTSHNDSRIGLTDAQVIQARSYCQWFDANLMRQNKNTADKAILLSSCSLEDFANPQSHFSNPMSFCDAGGGRLVAYGEIVEGVSARFDRIVRGAVPQTIVLDSPGGLVGEARGMAQLIRSRGLNTHVLGECSSACVSIMSGGVLRTASADASFGLHRHELKRPEKFNDHNFRKYRSETRKFYETHGVDPELESIEWAVPNKQIMRISAKEARVFNLVNG